MKTLFLFTLASLLALNLSARENPFSMIDTFEEESGKMLELNETPNTVEGIQEAQYIKQMQQQMGNNTNANKNSVEQKSITPKEKPAPKTYSKQEVDSLIQKTKSQTEQKTKEIVKKELANTKIVEPEQVVYVKPRPDVSVDDALVAKNILPFLKIEYNDNKLLIHTEHKVSKKFSVVKENKLVIDYKAKVNFNTKKDEIDSKTFKKIAVGNHKTEGFFRVAIELVNKPSNYDVTYNDNIITITKKN